MKVCQSTDCKRGTLLPRTPRKLQEKQETTQYYALDTKAMAGLCSNQHPKVSTVCLITVAAVRTDPIVRRVAEAGGHLC